MHVGIKQFNCNEWKKIFGMIIWDNIKTIMKLKPSYISKWEQLSFLNILVGDALPDRKINKNNTVCLLYLFDILNLKKNDLSYLWWDMEKNPKKTVRCSCCNFVYLLVIQFDLLLLVMIVNFYGNRKHYLTPENEHALCYHKDISP